MAAAKLFLDGKSLFNDKKVNEVTAFQMQPLRKYLLRCASA
jgi:hypothetical protein